MRLTDEQVTELSKKVEPVIEWLNENTHPYVDVHIQNNGFQVTELLAGVPVDKYIKD